MKAKEMKVIIKELIALSRGEYPFSRWGDKNIEEYLTDIEKQV